MDQVAPAHSVEDLQQTWDFWHRRAEAVFKVAVDRGWAAVARPAERSKGSEPVQRPVDSCGVGRRPESMCGRRLRRLHRAAAERLRHFGVGARGGTPLAEHQIRHWKAAVRDQVVELVSFFVDEQP